MPLDHLDLKKLPDQGWPHAGDVQVLPGHQAEDGRRPAVPAAERLPAGKSQRVIVDLHLQDTGVKIGSDARWQEKHSTACGLEVLDENAVLTVIRTSDATIDEEQCRVAVRELAKKFFAAVQP
ncbi:hypothetical protein ACWGE0_34810 [Lentzea sp. NPDC054927]